MYLHKYICIYNNHICTYTVYTYIYISYVYFFMAARSIVSKHQELPGLYFKGRPFCRRNAFSEVIEAAFSALGKELEDFDLGG